MTSDSGGTTVGINGEQFTIDGEPTYVGQSYAGQPIAGLLFNSRMVQAVFDDDNPETRDRWTYPDTGEWDPERNVREFCEAMPDWYEKGLRAVAVNLQGGRPVRNVHEGGTDPAATEQPWIVSAFRADGSLKEAWLARLNRVLGAADDLGMVVILGLFYGDQDQRLDDEASVERGVRNVVEWLHDREYRNVLIEINNECDTDAFEHESLRPDRVHELIDLAGSIERDGFSYAASTSFTGGVIPPDNVVAASDYVLMHGNLVDDPGRIAEMVDEVRDRSSYEPMPVVFNEDDVAMLHDAADGFSFGEEPNHLSAAIDRYASWGYYDKGQTDYERGFQCVPVNWEISTDRKRAFFDYLDRITGGDGA